MRMKQRKKKECLAICIIIQFAKVAICIIGFTLKKKPLMFRGNNLRFV